MGNVCDCHSTSRSSSWKRLFWLIYVQPKNQPQRTVKQFILETTVWLIYVQPKNQPQRTVKQLFDVTKEVGHGSERNPWNIRDQQSSWKRTTLFTDRAVQLSSAKAQVFSDSVLCMGRIPDTPVSAWKEKIDWFMKSSQCQELDRIDGEPMEFEWKNFTGFTTLQILAGIQNMMTEMQCEPEQFPGRIILMSMYNDIVWGDKGNA